jgi:hypothetical protein
MTVRKSVPFGSTAFMTRKYEELSTDALLKRLLGEVHQIGNPDTSEGQTWDDIPYVRIVAAKVDMQHDPQQFPEGYILVDVEDFGVERNEFMFWLRKEAIAHPEGLGAHILGQHMTYTPIEKYVEAVFHLRCLVADDFTYCTIGGSKVRVLMPTWAQGLLQTTLEQFGHPSSGKAEWFVSLEDILVIMG